jgi:hypothetical protein
VARELWVAIRDAVEKAAAAWMGLDLYVRRRIAFGVGVVAVVAAFGLFAVPVLPCQFPGGDACPPPDNAASVVPADALAYVHIDTDSSSDQYQAATDLASRIPTLSAQIVDRLIGQLPAAAGSTAAFADEVRPWLGDEAALALLPARGPPQEIEILAVADRGKADAYQRRIAGPAPARVPYRGVQLVRGRGGIVSGFVGGFLVIGTRAGLEAAIDVQTSAAGTAALSDSSAASVRDALSSQRVADAYLSAAGASAVAGRTTGLLAPLAPFFAPGNTKGVAMGLVAEPNGLGLEIRSALDQERAAAKPGFFAAFPSFDPTLAAKLPAGTLAYLGFGRPGQAISALLRQASSQQPGLAQVALGLLSRARRVSHLPVSGDLLAALGNEGALAIEPAPPGGVPYLLYLGSGIDVKNTRAALARLQVPLARSLAPGSGGFQSTTVGGVQAQTLTVSPAVELSYAIVDRQLVVATNPAGIAAVAHGGLSSAPAYGQATAGMGGSVSLLTYLDLGGLIALGERAGLASDPAYATFAPDFHQLQAFALSVTRTPQQLATDGRLVLGPGSLQSRPPQGR